MPWDGDNRGGRQEGPPDLGEVIKKARESVGLKKGGEVCLAGRNSDYPRDHPGFYGSLQSSRRPQGCRPSIRSVFSDGDARASLQNPLWR